MPVSITQARDEIFGLLRREWEAESFKHTPDRKVPEVRWPGVEKKELPSTDAVWIRVSLQHTSSGPGALGKFAGKRLFTRTGLLVVQVFTPLSADPGGDMNCRLSRVVQAAFEGDATEGGVWFRNATIREIGASDSWLQTNVTVSFTYDELT